MTNNNSLAHYLIQTGRQFSQSAVLSCTFYWGVQSKHNILQHLLPWTFPKLNTHPRLPTFSEQLIWIAVIRANEILGFVLLHPHQVESEILSFKIHPEYRNQGIAKFLLQQVEQLCRQRQIQSLKILYRTYWENNSYWEKVLQQSVWDNRSILLYYISIDQAVKDQIAQRFQDRNWQPDYDYQIETFSYDRLFQTMQHSKWQESKQLGLSPLQLPKNQVNFNCSFLVIHKESEEIVGWLICHQLQANLLQLTTFYLLPEHRKSGKAVLSKLADRLQNQEIKLNFMVKSENRKIMAFVRRYLLPEGAQCFEQVLIRKALA
ncbi:MAG: GNAT family N-acetyltransferase [Bacteroidota bacterium]